MPELSNSHDGLDPEGYLEVSCALEKIPPIFQPLLDESIALLQSTFATSLHSIYLYGSVATGHAQPAKSDLDLLVLFADAISPLHQAEIEQVAATLTASHLHLVREVGIGAASLHEALAKESLPGLGCFLKHLCLCVSGEDIRPLLPKFRPSIEVARGFNGDYAAVTQTMLTDLAQTDQTSVAQSVMRRLCRKTVRTGFSLVMPRLGRWTTDLETSVNYFCRYYPEKRTQMALILSWIQHPPKDSASFLQTMKPLSDWLAAEIGRVIGT
jgi:predicted nucleotidyltransferase